MLRALSFPLLLALAAELHASVVTYDLKTDWSNTNNPNGVWRYLAGSTPLPFQSSFVGCFNSTAGVTGGWAPGNVVHNCLPAFFQATGTGLNSDYLAGDILVHSWDFFNGGSNGQTIIAWTAPVDGTIDYSGNLWYAHSAVQRINEFFLTLGATQLATGTIAWNGGFTRSSPNSFSGTGLTVHAGDVVALEVVKDPSLEPGSLDGVNLTIVETSAGAAGGPTAPEPGTMLLGGAASVVLLLRSRNRAA